MPSAASAPARKNLGESIAQVRRFNRFYTRRIGLLQRGFLASEFSLAEVRVLYELAHNAEGKWSAAELGAELGLDAGYLSRILARFEKRGLIRRRRSERDARSSRLELTPRGSRAFAPLDERQDRAVAEMLGALPVPEQRRLTAAFNDIVRLLGGGDEQSSEPYILRPHQPGDLGWVVHRHGALYAAEWGYDERFEALVAKIAAHFLRRFDPRRERCWIAERHGEIVGSVFAVQKSKTVSQLRLLLVEPSARGLGIGRRLVEECIRFARHAGYKTMVLWTQSELTAARKIYERAGFKLRSRKRHSGFGRPSVAEEWEIDLRDRHSAIST